MQGSRVIARSMEATDSNVTRTRTWRWKEGGDGTGAVRGHTQIHIPTLLPSHEAHVFHLPYTVFVPNNQNRFSGPEEFRNHNPSAPAAPANPPTMGDGTEQNRGAAKTASESKQRGQKRKKLADGAAKDPAYRDAKRTASLPPLSFSASGGLSLLSTTPTSISSASQAPVALLLLLRYRGESPA
ncbi:MAG: hypothetical protein LQ340_007283 [Diploschistes diacapsis]|nr:MAG: hypothetical protein LQ340_007283 [Diploschistes diacapsis]